MYNHKRRLYINGEVPLNEMFVNPLDELTDEVFALERCKSRLHEMQSQKYLDEASHAHYPTHEGAAAEAHKSH